MRLVFGCITALAAALAGGLIMGEYPLSVLAALFAGVLFGLAIAEAAITVAKSNDTRLAVAAAVSSFVGLSWGFYIAANEHFDEIGLRWLGALLALVSAGWWVRTLGSRGASSQPSTESP